MDRPPGARFLVRSPALTVEKIPQLRLKDKAVNVPFLSCLCNEKGLKVGEECGKPRVELAATEPQSEQQISDFNVFVADIAGVDLAGNQIACRAYRPAFRIRELPNLEAR